MQGPGQQPPRMLGRYALYEKIASGGMASVHIGRLMGPVGFARTVAIKRMHEQFAEDPEFVSMFLDEARLAARIRHPNVVPTLDVVATAGELFLVMEFVQGESLARLIRETGRARIPPPVVSAIIVGVLSGLHAAHEAKSDRGEPLGIVHRDVSPHNVIVGVDGAARVLDFGVAKAAGRVQTTREGQLKGKLAYMAPEQVRGEVSRASDVYAASVCLWEALTGKRLFSGEHDGQVLDRVMRGATEPPSAHVSGIARALDALTMKGLNMDPARRFATAREMARALEDAVPPTTASRVGEWVEAAAKKAIDERSARIAFIESDTSLQAMGASSEAPQSTGPGPVAAPPPGVPRPVPSTRKPEVPAVPPAPISQPSAPGRSAGLASPGSYSPGMASPPAVPFAAAEAAIPPPPAWVGSAPGTEPPPSPPGSEPIVVQASDEVIPTQLSSGSVSAPGRPSFFVPLRAAVLAQRPRAVAIAVGSAGSLLVLILLVALWPSSHSSTTEPAAAASAPVDTVESPAVTETPPSPTPEPPKTAAAAPSPAPAPPPPAVAPAPPPATAEPVTEAPAHAAPHPVHTSAQPGATGHGTRNCDPPWYIDKVRGVRVFKTECL